MSDFLSKTVCVNIYRNYQVWLLFSLEQLVIISNHSNSNVILIIFSIVFNTYQLSVVTVF